MRPIIIGIAGGTGAGKTTFLKKITQSLGSEEITIIQHDAYYRDRSNLRTDKRETINYDHPDALETDLLVAHLQKLRKGHQIEIPIYDFITHTRKATTRAIYPQRVIIVEGILILKPIALHELMDIKIYIDTDADTRFIRRLRRDVVERGRTMHSVIQQYLNTVKPMHLMFVEPNKQHADIIISGDGDNKVALDMLLSKIRSVLKDPSTSN